MGLDKKELIIECERLHSFLENNQLVQANAINQKLESMSLNKIKEEADPAKMDEHLLWKPFRCTLRIKGAILSGKTDAARIEAESLTSMLRVLP